jgi:hypothetical protein
MQAKRTENDPELSTNKCKTRDAKKIMEDLKTESRWQKSKLTQENIQKFLLLLYYLVQSILFPLKSLIFQ